ncbi:decaprenyl-phosphate phosphoribosyltransferase [bacterium]|nr:MAG: decaprenyl-phosphate phosphoribosyltransferase [bacterium]
MSPAPFAPGSGLRTLFSSAASSSPVAFARPGPSFFCALSGAAYLINDWQDLESDRLHPTKKHRPMAAGRISLRAAGGIFAVLMLIALSTSALLFILPRGGIGFSVAALSYFVLTLSYSFRLKHEVIIDVLAVAAGFVVRVVAGCLAIPVVISPWILFCTFTLALFVALCKRRAELLEVGESAGTRHVLKGYTPEMLDTFIAIAAGLTIIAYSLYTFNAPHTSALGKGFDQTPLLMTSIPFVVYGVFRYLLLAHSSPVGGEPEQMLRDRPLMVCVLTWGLWVAFLTLLPVIG